MGGRLRWLLSVVVLVACDREGANGRAPLANTQDPSPVGFWQLADRRCTATIVEVRHDRAFALSAAHCVGRTLGQVTLFDGDGTPSTPLAVEGVIAHPSYAGTQHDLAVLSLYCPNRALTPLRLAEPPDGVPMIMQAEGFGRSPGVKFERRKNVRLVERQDDRLRLESLGPAPLCFGDSGGPVRLGQNGPVVAIIARGVAPDCWADSEATALDQEHRAFVARAVDELAARPSCSVCRAHASTGGRCDRIRAADESAKRGDIPLNKALLECECTACERACAHTDACNASPESSR